MYFLLWGDAFAVNLRRNTLICQGLVMDNAPTLLPSQKALSYGLVSSVIDRGQQRKKNHAMVGSDMNFRSRVLLTY